MKTRFGTFLDYGSLEARIVNTHSPLISHEERKLSAPKTISRERGFFIRDKSVDKYIYLPCIGALEILKDMREVETWKTNGMVIGAPAVTPSSKNGKTVDEEILHTPFVRRWPEYVLSDPLTLTRKQSKVLFDFLLENEQLLNELAEKDEGVARRQLRDMFKKIADYGRKKRLKISE